MRGKFTRCCGQSKSRGAFLPLVGVLLIVFIGIAALAIDIGYLSTTKNELQNVADAAALAATSKLGQFYFENGEYNPASDLVVIKNTAKSLINQAAGKDILIDDNDICVGLWTNGAVDIDCTVYEGQNAVKVIARRDTIKNNPISSFFAGVFGVDLIGVRADAVAALSGQANFEPGEIKLPFALSQLQFPDACKEPITFTSNDDCAAWHTFTLSELNTPALIEIFYGMILAHEDGAAWLQANGNITGQQPTSPFVSPEVDSGVTAFTVTEGTNAALFTGDPSPMKALFEFWKTRDKDGDDSVWTTTIPVYKEPQDAIESDVCSPTSKFDPRVIVGGADIIVRAVNGPPDNSITADIICKYKQIRGSGGYGGNTGTIPNLVE